MPYAKMDDPQSLNLFAYVNNNPLSKGDPDGHDECCKALKDFLNGANGAWESDNLLGIPNRNTPDSDAGRLGAQVGDGEAAVQGGMEVLGGLAAQFGGGVEAVLTSPAAGTGVGAFIPAVGVGVAIVGGAVSAHGTATLTTAVYKSSKTLRREWEEANKKPWPKDPKTEGNQDISHIKAKADKGTDHVSNIRPQPHDQHMDMHKKNGDFKRWGARRKKK